MKRQLCAFMVLMAVSSSAQAGTISFSVGGHRVRIEAPRGCSSSSCASISIPGFRKNDDETRATVATPAVAAPAPAVQPPPPAPASIQPPAPAAPRPLVASPAPPPPPVVYTTASTTTQQVSAPPPPLPQIQPESVTRPCAVPPVERPDVRPALPVLNVLHQDDPIDSPLGDWQTEGRGIVRIAECGRAFCGYAIKEGGGEKGEAILINMKAKSDSQWSGSVYSKDSGDTYYGTMRLRGPNSLRVEACAFSHFYCKSNNWTRITSNPVMTSRRIAPEPRS